MKLALALLTAASVIPLAGCQSIKSQSSAPPPVGSPSVAATVGPQDCIAPVPQGFTRIFIGTPVPGGQQSGSSYTDPLDGTTAAKLDTILSSIANGQNPTWGAQANIPPQNLIVCLGSGTFQTNGQYDWRFNRHIAGSTLGFTVEKNWKFHGRGISNTTLQLASFLPTKFVDAKGVQFDGGSNNVIGTHSSSASGVEVSDLTIDVNHDGLLPAGGLPLNLTAVVLRSDQGGHWIHDVNVIGASGDAALINLKYEVFIVWIWGNSAAGPQQSAGSVVERVNVTQPGRPVATGSAPGSGSDGIVVSNAVAEIRNNLVDGYAIAYGGFGMGPAEFHDNVAQNTVYGFNADSFDNNGVVLRSNQFIRPSSYGIVIGGGPSLTFMNWTVDSNHIELSHDFSTALVLRGQVQNSVVINNTIVSSGNTSKETAIISYPAASGSVNLSNVFQGNRVDSGLLFNFSADPNLKTDCRFNNRDLLGNPLPAFPDNSTGICP